MDKNTFVTKAIFVEKDVLQNKKKGKKGFSKKIKKVSFFFWKTVKKIEKWLTNFFSFQMSNDRNSENIYSWKGLNKCFGVEKSLVILFERKRLKKKEKEWKKITKRDEQMKKVLFFEQIKEIKKKVSHQEK